MFDLSQGLAFLLILTRVSTFLMVSPLFWLPVPRLAKVVICLFVAFFLFSTLKIQTIDFPGGLWDLGLAVAREAGLGFILGFTCSLIFYGLTIAGQLIDVQMGFFVSYIFDPTSGTQATITSRFLFLLGLVLFFILDGHHVLLAGLARSYDFVPILGLSLKGDAALSLIRIFSQMVSLAVQIAAPVMAVVLIIDICLGILGRTSPEMNIFMLGFPVKIGAGMVILASIIPLLTVVFRYLIEIMERDLLTILKGLA